MRLRQIPWRPRTNSRPSLFMFSIRGGRLIKRNRMAGARRRTVLAFPDLAFYPEHAPPPMRIERHVNCLHKIVLRGLFRSFARHPA